MTMDDNTKEVLGALLIVVMFLGTLWMIWITRRGDDA